MTKKKPVQEKLPRETLCVGCGRAARGAGADPNVPMLLVAPYLYRRGSGSRIRSGRGVNVCESCLVGFLVGRINGKGLRVVNAFRDSISRVYKAATEANGE